MQLLPILTAVAEQSIPGRPATWQESLRLMGAGWGSIFIVILVIMLCVYLLNRILCHQIISPSPLQNDSPRRRASFRSGRGSFSAPPG